MLVARKSVPKKHLFKTYKKSASEFQENFEEIFFIYYAHINMSTTSLIFNYTVLCYPSWKVIVFVLSTLLGRVSHYGVGENIKLLETSLCKKYREIFMNITI